MDFLNEPVMVVPRAEEISYTPLERNYLKVMRLEWLITMIIFGFIAGIALYFLPKLHHTVLIVSVIAVWILIAILWFILTGLSFPRKGYALREHDITYRSGWLIQSIRTSPFSRIQHSNVSSGPLERRFGLASLIIYTAGSGGADTKIPGLKEEDAHNIKEWLNKRVSNEPGTGE